MRTGCFDQEKLVGQVKVAPRLRTVALAVLSLAICGGRLTSAAQTSLARYEFTEPQMGVPFKIVLYAPDDEVANRAAAAAYARVSALNAVLSDYDEDSELSRLSRGSPHAEAVAVTDDLSNVLLRAQELSKATDGAFDVTVGSACATLAAGA